MRACPFSNASRCAYPVELGGGWRVRLLEDSEELDIGVLPVEIHNADAGMTWRIECTEQERADRLIMATRAMPADAYRSFMLADADVMAYERLNT